jgi:hypothetical protein
MRRRQLLQLLPSTLLASALAAVLGGQAGPVGPEPQGRVRFLAVADTGSGNSHQRAVGAQMAAVHRQRPVDLVVLGATTSIPRETWR